MKVPAIVKEVYLSLKNNSDEWIVGRESYGVTALSRNAASIEFGHERVSLKIAGLSVNLNFGGKALLEAGVRELQIVRLNKGATSS